jgi:hypothetical protein
MSEWTKILTHPLGLTGFALFLVFGLFAKLKRRDEQRWLFMCAVVMAFIALVGGLSLAYVQMRSASATTISPAKPGPSPAPLQDGGNTQQVSTGAGSPNVKGVNGDVNITIDQSSGKVEDRKSKKTSEKEKK